MKKKTLGYALLLCAILFGHSAIACTIVSCSMHGEVFSAANEDDFTPFSRIWFNPGTTERYGSVCFGAPDMQIGAAMNEYGLFYDFTAQYGIDPGKYPLKNPFNGDLMFEILGKCKTVSQALEFLKMHDYTSTSQVLLADATGNAVIFHVGEKVLKNGNYQINTNFDVFNLKTGNYACGRYDIANQMLSGAKNISVKFFKNLLNATHQEGELSTQYSNIYDLKRGKIYVYLFHNYEHCYTIDLKKELAKGYHLERLDTHFPVSFAYQTYLQNHPIYKTEKIIEEIRKNGLQETITKYVAEIKNSIADSVLNEILLNVGLQLMKETNSQHRNGGMWEYFFGLENGYKIIHFNDERLNAIKELYAALLEKQWTDAKLKNFMVEILAYIDLVQNKNDLAKIKYLNLIKNEADVFPFTFTRSREMINRMNK